MEISSLAEEKSSGTISKAVLFLSQYFPGGTAAVYLVLLSGGWGSDLVAGNRDLERVDCG